MKLVLCAGPALALSTVVAHADQFAGMYGNTVNIEHPDGSVTTVFVNADKTWINHAPDGKTYRGTFMWKDDTHVCLTLVDPAPEPGDSAQECHEVTGNHKVGDSWNQGDDKDHPTVFSITAGRS